MNHKDVNGLCWISSFVVTYGIGYLIGRWHAYQIERKRQKLKELPKAYLIKDNNDN